MLICCSGTCPALKHQLEEQNWLQTHHNGTFVTEDHYWTISILYPTEAFLPRLHRSRLLAIDWYLICQNLLVHGWQSNRARAYAVTDSSMDPDDDKQVSQSLSEVPLEGSPTVLTQKLL